MRMRTTMGQGFLFVLAIVLPAAATAASDDFDRVWRQINDPITSGGDRRALVANLEKNPEIIDLRTVFDSFDQPIRIGLKLTLPPSDSTLVLRFWRLFRLSAWDSIKAVELRIARLMPPSLRSLLRMIASSSA